MLARRRSAPGRTLPPVPSSVQEDLDLLLLGEIPSQMMPEVGLVPGYDE